MSESIQIYETKFFCTCSKNTSMWYFKKDKPKTTVIENRIQVEYLARCLLCQAKEYVHGAKPVDVFTGRFKMLVREPAWITR